MKVTLNWLKQYVAFDWSPEELTERLTMLGLEVEGVQKLGGEFAGIVVAQVLSRDKHPNADKLSVCRVADGTGERQIVCGAQNFQAGDKVPLILPGASLPLKPGDKEPFTIKVGKIRSVESHGMMCSPAELGLPNQVDGLLILRPDAPVGQPFAEYLGRAGSDVVYDLEVTPNRPDLNSVLGIAREIAAVTGNPLKVPDIQVAQPSRLAEAGETPALICGDLVAVQIKDADLCPRYTARVVTGVKIGPSPDWLRSALEKVGLRSINNVVDVSNFVMLETGQPLHTFDYHLVRRAGFQPAPGRQASSLSENSNEAESAAGRKPVGLDRLEACPPTTCPPTIVVRRALDGEKFTTLDGRDHTLTTDHLLIADEQKAIALAGVMGGQNTEISDATVDVLIESAYFTPTNIRRTSKTLGLRTDASYRFERGADINACDYASKRCAQLILETAGGTLAEGVVDAYPEPVKAKVITLRPRKVKELLGVDVSDEDQTRFLQSLGIEAAAWAPGGADRKVAYKAPSWRVDMKREADLIEEIARLFGVDKIPATAPRRASGSHPFDTVVDQFAEVRRLLTGLGLNEAQGQTLINDTAAKLVTPNLVMLANPLSSDMNALRPSLLPGLLDTLHHNLTRKNGDVRLFEVGRVFTLVNGQAKESWRVAIAMTGARVPGFWAGADREAKCDLFDLKGILEEFLEQAGLRGIAYTKRPDSTELFLESAIIAFGGKQELGHMGQLLPKLAKQYFLRDAVVLAELNLDLLLARRNATKSFRPLPQFPSVRRDVAMIVPEATTHDAVLQVVRQTKPANLESIELFDVFRGKHIPDGQKSLAYAFTYRAADKTLTDVEVTTAHARLVEAFKLSLKAALRE
jgi:phenylalanyl-tRNA synthetase beta chain